MNTVANRAGRSLRTMSLLLAALLVLPAAMLPDGPAPEVPAADRHVILISVDGLRPDAVTAHSQDELPNFYRLRKEAAFTDNARTDYDVSVTLPNHMSQLTGRPVNGVNGHNWVINKDPKKNVTLHSNKGSYVTSVFDVVHDAGLRTGAYVSKSKFELLEQSYNEKNGARDLTGEDNGRDKIDEFLLMEDTRDLIDLFVEDMKNDPFNFAFVHLANPDAAGHRYSWNLKKNSRYMKSIREVDALLGKVFKMIDSDPRLAGKTMIILTADHGGQGFGHGEENNPADYTIPFYVWGRGVTPGNLYALNHGTIADPGTDRPSYEDAVQPIRNGSAANLATRLLSLPPVPDSRVNFLAGLNIAAPTHVATAPR